MKKLLIFFPLLFCVSLYAQQMQPVVEWQKLVGGSKTDAAHTVIPTVDHGYLMVGYSYSNDGAVTGHHGTTDSCDGWVVKLNSKGDVEWQRSYGGSNFDEFRHVIQAGNGDFICVGSTRSDDGDITALHKDSGVVYDLWLLRIDRVGNIIWSKVYGGSNSDRGQVIRRTPDGNFIVGGEASSVDYDLTVNHGASDMWILKINDLGNLLWQKTYGNPNGQYVTNLIVASDNTYLVSGYQTYNRWPTPTQFDTPVYASAEFAALRIDNNGNTIWERFPLFTNGNPGPSAYYHGIAEQPGTNSPLLIGAKYNESSAAIRNFEFRLLDKNTGNTLSVNGTDLFPGDLKETGRGLGPELATSTPDGTLISTLTTGLGDWGGSITAFNMLPNGSRHAVRFTAKLNPPGQNGYDLTGYYFGSIVPLENDGYIVGGGHNQRHYFPPGATFGDAWIVKFKAQNDVKGKAFIDVNGNGIKEANEHYFTDGYVESHKNGRTISSFIDVSGSFMNKVDTGTYQTTLRSNKNYYYNISPANHSSTFTTYAGKDSFDFALTPIPGKKDLAVYLRQTGAIRPGFTTPFIITAINRGTADLSNVVVKLALPNKMTYVSAQPAGTLQADSLTWNIANLLAGDTSHINLVLQTEHPPAVAIGDVMKFTTTIYPVAGDEAPADNVERTYASVTGAYDPNDKNEHHSGRLFISHYHAGDPLTYTIRFQNTGNDTAFNIIIRDTLSTKLAARSIEMAGSSHPYQLSIKDSMYLTWTFKDILLVDSNTNEPGSHGYISFRIKPIDGLKEEDVVANSASIYFDFNLPITTNTHQTKITADPPVKPLISGMMPAWCSAVGSVKIKLLNLPVSGTVNILIDAANTPVSTDSTFTIPLTAGNHTVTVIYSNASGSETTTAGYTVYGAVTPKVSLNAEAVTITNPVVVTATPTGGGKNPVYLFAWDKNFSNLLSGAGNTVTIAANNLAMGNNKVFVKMTTSEDCYTSQIAIDSITIRRDAPTGIVDVDNPGQLINVYPNPFEGPIYVNGLSAAKRYRITISNLVGQVLHTKHVANRTTAAISNIQPATGIYWLSIYDEKKNRLLGSVQLIKQ